MISQTKTEITGAIERALEAARKRGVPEADAGRLVALTLADIAGDVAARTAEWRDDVERTLAASVRRSSEAANAAAKDVLEYAPAQAHCQMCHQILPQWVPTEVVGRPDSAPARVVAALAGRQSGMTVDELVDALYADDPDGGPENARRCTYLAVLKARRRLRPHGFSVEWVRRDGRYRIVSTPCGCDDGRGGRP